MAREPQITRTIVTTKAKVLCVDLSNKSVQETDFAISRSYRNDEHLLRAIDNQIKIDGLPLKPIQVISSETSETLYAMTENEFIKYAKPVTARTSKISITNK